MSARPLRSKPSFDASRPLTVRRPFKMNGRAYGRGAEFDWRSLMITPRRVRQMYDAGHLVHGDIDPAMVPDVDQEIQNSADVQPEEENKTAATDGTVLPKGFKSFRISDLRSLAKSFGLDDTGSRKELIERLKASAGE